MQGPLYFLGSDRSRERDGRERERDRRERSTSSERFSERYDTPSSIRVSRFSHLL
jgi:hypothetical protein